VNHLNRLGPGAGFPNAELRPDTWHRVAIAVDLAATPPTIAFFVDGLKAGETDPGQGRDGRWAIRISGNDWGLYFDHDDNGETEIGYLSSLQFWNERVPDGALIALGGPSPDGIHVGPIANPYLVSVLPSPESMLIPERSNVLPRPLIEAVIINGANVVDITTLSLALNGIPAVEPEITKSGSTNAVRYVPPQLLNSLSTQTVTVAYSDMTGNRYTNEWQFLVGRYAALPAAAAGTSDSAHTPGFLVRTAQAPLGSVLAA